MQKFKVPASILGSLLLLIGLGACSAQQVDSFEQCQPALTKGALANNVSVLGGFGTDPVVSIPDGFTVGGPQRALVESSKENVTRTLKPSVMTVNYALIASDGNTIIEQSKSFSSGKGHDFIPVGITGTQGAFIEGLICAAKGDRLVIVVGAEEAASIAGSLGAPENTNFVALVDVHHVQEIAVSGKEQIMPSGFPGVVTDENGTPGVVVNPAKAPTTEKKFIRIEGDGPEVEADDAVVANVLQVTWSGELLENTFTTTGPRFLGTSETPTMAVRSFLNEAAVGSQLVIIQPNPNAEADIFVVDILAAG